MSQARIAPLLALVATLAGGCAGTPAAPGVAAPASDRARMIKLLDEVAAASKVDDPFMGRNQPDAIRKELAALPEGVPDLRRWLYHGLIARHELRIGNVESAIEHARAAYGELTTFAGEIPEEKQIETVFNLGVAYLRLGEQRNCCARHTSESCILPIRGGGVHVEVEGSTQALRYFGEVLQRTAPDSWWNVKARWLYNIAAMTLGRWPDGVPEAWRIAPAVYESAEPFPRFPEVAPALGLDAFDLAGGAIADDFDGDGRLDVLTSTADPDGGMHFYRNKGDGAFEDRASAAGLDGLRGGLDMVQADYDGDGDLDVLVLRGAWWRSRGRHPNSLLRNDGKGHFTDVTFAAGLGDVHYPSHPANWADYDLDGDLDVYVGNETSSDIAAPCQLFRNDGKGHFTDVAAEAGVTNDGYTKSVAWGDYDGDGDPDLYVSNLGNPNRLFRNDGKGRFTDVAAEAGVERPLASFGSWFFDYDGDGDLDLFVAAYGGPNLPPEVGFVAADFLGLPHRAETDRLYRNDGKGRFTDVSEDSGVAHVTLPMGHNYGDVDNDGRPDYYLATGYPYYEGLIPNRLFHNVDGRRFVEVTTAAGVGHLQKGHGVAFADLDDDGDQDLYAQTGGMYPGDPYRNALFANPGFGNHWLKVRLVGQRANRFGLGARIRVDVIEKGAPRSIYKEASSGASFGANPLSRYEIGLGRAERIERVEIRWPGRAEPQVVTGVPLDRLIEVTEGEEGFRERELRPFSLGG